MSIIQTVSQYDFEYAFKDHDRENQFTYEGKKALYEDLNHAITQSMQVRTRQHLTTLSTRAWYTTKKVTKQ